MSTKTIALIHGLSVSKHSWDAWVKRYESRGYKVVAPAYHPGLDKPFEELKKNPNDPLLSTVTLPQVMDHLVSVIQSLNEKPIIMGHSFGGLLTQLLIQRDLGTAGVAIDGAPPPGVLPTQLSFYRSVFPAINPLISEKKPWFMTFKQFQYAWTHTYSADQQRKAYESIIVPESRVLYRSALTKDAKVDWEKSRAPLLFIAGEKDHIFQSAVNRANYKRYSKSPSITEYKEYLGETHYTIVAGKNWEKVADYALDWAVQVQTRTTADMTPRLAPSM